MALEFITRKKDDVLFIQLSGEIGLTEEYKFRQEMNEALKEKPAKLVVDLSKITLLSSYGITALVNLWKHQQIHHGRICIICPSNHVYDSLMIAGTEKIIPVFLEESQALAFYQVP